MALNDSGEVRRDLRVCGDSVWRKIAGRHLEARPEIQFAYLHGSFQTGDPYRDIDVAVWRFSHGQ